MREINDLSYVSNGRAGGVMNRGKVFWIGRSFLRGCSYFSVEKSRMRKVSGKFVSNHFFPEYTFKYICEEIEEMLAAGEQKQFQLVEISSRENDEVRLTQTDDDR